MIPSGLSALLILLALVPGWLNLKLLRRFRPPPRSTSALAEFMEILAVGVGTTGISILIVFLVPHRTLPFTLDVQAWATGGEKYLRTNARPAVASAMLILIIAFALAVLLYFLQKAIPSGEFHPEGSVWVHALGSRAKGKVPWVGLQLLDGRLVEGVLQSFSLEDLGENRDIALQSPIRITAPAEGSEARIVDIDRLIVPFRQVAHVIVIEAPER